MARFFAPAAVVRPRGLVLRGRVWLGFDHRPRPGIVIVDETGTVAAAGPATDIYVPPGLPAYGDDLSWVGPGLVDAHVHLAFGAPADIVRGGVVAVRDLGAPPADAAGWRSQRSGLVVATAGPIITAPGGYPTTTWGAGGFGLGVGEVEQARHAVAELARSGVDVIKIALEPARGAPIPSLDVVTAAVHAAHDAGLAVTAHALTVAMVELALDAGVDELAHVPVEPLPSVLVERIAAAGTTVVSSLHALAAYPGSAVLKNAADLVAAAVPVAYGTDFGNAGTRAGAEPRELELLAEAGLGAAGALRAATEAAADVAGLRERPGLGRLAVGAPAALVALAGDPLENPERWRHPQAVVIGAHVWSPDRSGSRPEAPTSLAAVATVPRSRALFTPYRGDLFVGLVVFVASLLSGALGGVLWEWIAKPATEVVTTGISDGSIFNDRDSERWTSTDGWFAVICGLAGLLCAALAYARFRRYGVAITIALTLGGLAASLIASQVGEARGPEPVSAHLSEPPGTVFTSPLIVHASAVLFIWPIAAVALVMALTAGFAREHRSRS